MLIAQSKQLGLVIGIAALVLLTNLGGPRLWDRDEPRNAGCAREMLARGEVVVPYFNGELRTHKPVLLYWCIMASYLGLGVNEFAARLPSALCALGSVVCVYRLGRRLFGPQAGVWAGIALATSLMFVVAGRAATPDALLIFCSTLALTIYVCGTFRPRFETTPHDAPAELIAGPHAYFPQHWPTVLAMYGAMGLGVLAKGPVGFLLPTAVIGMFLLIVRRQETGSQDDHAAEAGWRAAASAPVGEAAGNAAISALRWLQVFEPLHFLKTCWAMRPFTALFAVLAVALPWYGAVGLATDGDFLRGFFLEHNLGRATATMEHHGGSLLFYPAAILVGFFPWSVFAAPLAIDTALQLRRGKIGPGGSPAGEAAAVHAGYWLAVCWIGVYVVLFSLARTKLPSYVTPCYPALALLVGNYIDRWSRGGAAVAGRWLWAAFGCLALVGVGIAIAVPLVARQMLPGEAWLGLIGLTPLAGGVACLGLAAVRSFQAAAATFALSAVAFATLLFSVGTERIDRHQTNQLLWQAIYARSPQPMIASYKVLEPSWVFYGGRPIHEFADSATGAPVSPAGAVPPAADRAAWFLVQQPNAFVITTETKARELEGRLPPQIGVIEAVPYFLKGKERLVVLGRGGPSPRLAGQPSPAPDAQAGWR
jgi:4-amino-4-deoxy-L-arabinose transferase-like glycosyltransferase